MENLAEAHAPVLAALANIDAFDKTSFGTWLQGQTRLIQRVATRTPPDRVYIDRPGRMCVVVGYSKSGDVLIQFIGDMTGRQYAHATRDLFDVTDSVREQARTGLWKV